MNDANGSKKRTALVTGASMGLGKEIARLFAADGHDVVAVARTEAKLKELATELETSNAAKNVKVHVVTADLGVKDGPKRVFDAVTKLGVDVDFLVNNAGFGTNGAFLDLDVNREIEMVQVNCASLLELTHRFGQGMRARGFGRILNIASTAGFQAGPFMATYYASKSFVVLFTEGLAYELRGSGVTVTAHCPGATATEFAKTSGNDKSKLFKSNVADAASTAKDAYDAMMRGKVIAIHGARNLLMMESQRIAPRSVVVGIAAGLNRP